MHQRCYEVVPRYLASMRFEAVTLPITLPLPDVHSETEEEEETYAYNHIDLYALMFTITA